MLALNFRLAKLLLVLYLTDLFRICFFNICLYIFRAFYFPSQTLLWCETSLPSLFFPNNFIFLYVFTMNFGKVLVSLKWLNLNGFVSIINFLRLVLFIVFSRLDVRIGRHRRRRLVVFSRISFG